MYYCTYVTWHTAECEGEFTWNKCQLRASSQITDNAYTPDFAVNSDTGESNLHSVCTTSNTKYYMYLLQFY